MTPLELTEDASKDVTNIYRYSVEHFGVARADRYIAELEDCLILLAQNPLMGKSYAEVRAGLRRHHHQSHFIYYRAKKALVRILRILGAAQDPVRHL